jgi:hypothetical protein
MKTKIISLFIILLFNHLVFAQQQKPGKNNTKEQQKKPNTKAKIHANSNSVYGSSDTHPKYIKETIPTKGKSKREVEIKTYKKPKK